LVHWQRAGKTDKIPNRSDTVNVQRNHIVEVKEERMKSIKSMKPRRESTVNLSQSDSKRKKNEENTIF